MEKPTKSPQPLEKLSTQSQGTFLPRQGTPRAYKSQGLAKLMPGLTRRVAGKRPTLIGDLQMAWTEIVGAKLAAWTRPVRLSAQTLHLETALGAGPVVALAQDRLLAQVQLHLGAAKVQRLRIHQVDFPLPEVSDRRDAPQVSVRSPSEPLTNAGNQDSDRSDLESALARLKARLEARHPRP